MKKCILFFTMIILILSMCACTDSAQKDTGGDTDIGGLFWDILHGESGEGSGNVEQENNDITNSVLPKSYKEGVRE